MTGSLYDSNEIRLLARNAVYIKKCMTITELGKILQLGASRGRKDSDCLKGKMKVDGLWNDKNLGLSLGEVEVEEDVE